MDHVGDVREWVETLDVLLNAHFREGVDKGALTRAEATELLARVSVVVDQGLATSY